MMEMGLIRENTVFWGIKYTFHLMEPIANII